MRYHRNGAGHRQYAVAVITFISLLVMALLILSFICVWFIS